MAMKKKGYRVGGRVKKMAKGGSAGGKTMRRMKKGGSVGGKTMTVAQLRAAAKKMGYKVSKA